MALPEKYITRADLGWGPTRAGRANPRGGLVVHYDSSDRNLANKDLDAAIAYWQWCRDFHMNTRGYVDVGYSWMATPQGYLLEGRGLYREQAAQRGANTTHYSVTLGLGPSDPITPEQINAVRWLRQWLMAPDTSISGAVFGHRDFNQTSCPGDRAYALVQGGTFAQPPGPITEVHDMLGLQIGSEGEAVKLLQLRVVRAGFGSALGEAGADSVYGSATAEAVRQCRAYVGSRAKDGYGDEMTAHAVDQLEAAVTKRALEGVTGGAPGDLPSEEQVTLVGTLKRN